MQFLLWGMFSAPLTASSISPGTAVQCRGGLGAFHPCFQADLMALCLCSAEVGTIFALSWLITWFGHVLSDFRHVVRLYDFFLACHPLMPIYFAAVVGIGGMVKDLLRSSEVVGVWGCRGRLAKPSAVAVSSCTLLCRCSQYCPW